MKRLFRFSMVFTLLLVLVMAVMGPVGPMVERAEAATTNFSPSSPGVYVVPFLISGQRTATATTVIAFDLPFPSTLVSVQATARVSGGTSPTLTVDVLEDGTSVLSSAISVTAGTVSFGTVSDAAIADEATVTIDLAIGGSSPTWDDISVVLILLRK